MELDHGEAGTADHVDFVHTGNTALKDRGHKVQDLHRRGSGQVNIRQDGVLGAAIVWRALPCLKEEGREKGRRIQ